MPILASDLSVRLSGGAANSDPNAAIGGAISSTVVGTGLHALFDQVPSGEAGIGITDYRCVYIHNAHATLTLQNAVVWVVSNTPSADTTVEIGLGTSVVGGTEQAVVFDVVAPTDVTFGAPDSKNLALFIGDIPAGSHKAVWIKRVINAGAVAYNNDGATIRFEGDTGA